MGIWNSGRDCWETLQIDLLSGLSAVYSETFPISGSMRNGVVYEHQTSAHLMDASGSLFSQLGGKLMPTPTASVANDGEGTETWLARRERVKQTANNGNGMGMPLTIAVQLLPTPMTTDDHHSSPADANRRSPGLRAVHALFPTPDAYSAERGGSQHPDKRRAGGHSVSLADVAEQQLLPTPRAADHSHSLTAPAAPESSWGPYAGAIDRWERVLGRPAPAPTEAGPKGGRRLSAAFVEWLMGLPEEWVTDPALDLSRTQQLKMLGNGVVPQQALYALQLAAVAA